MLARRYEEVFIGKDGLVAFAGGTKDLNEAIKYGDESIYSEFNRLIRGAITSIREIVERYDQSREELKRAVEPTQPKNSAVGEPAFAADENLRAIRHEFERFREHAEYKFGSIVEQIERKQSLGSEDGYDFS